MSTNTTPAKVTASQNAKAESSETKFDWGQIDYGGPKATKTLKIKNVGIESLRLTKVKTSCTCTTAQLIIDAKKSPLFSMHGGSNLLPAYLGNVFKEKERVLFMTLVFGAVITGELQPLGDERVMRVIYGALVASVLLSHAQNRIGGIIPEEISEDALRVSLLSLVENTDEGMRTIRDELMGVQRELFTGLRFFEHNILERTSNDCQLGGLITLLTYKHILESQELERKLGLEN